MPWLKIVVIVFAVAAVVGVCVDFHLHIINAPREQVLEVSMLTLFFGVSAGVLGVLDSKLSRK
jgi:hypothetical protein